MRATLLWQEKVSLIDSPDNSVYDICFSPDGSRMIAACGARVLVINVAQGSIEETLRNHKGVVLCVSYSFDGRSFASGGSDKTVIIWSESLQGSLKYVHDHSIQCLAYNPQANLLASCSVSDFGIWSPDKKSVDKTKVPAKVNVCAWTPDGLYLALGLANGTVTIRAKNCSEQCRIDRPGGPNSAIWGLAWARSSEDGQDMLCVADWGQCLSFYNGQGNMLMKERALNFDPTRLVYVKTNRECEYIIVAGANKAAALFTLEGVKVASVAEQESWIWSCAMKPNSSNIAVGTHGGLISFYDVQLLVVHALFKSLYAYRMNMTDVMVQNLLMDLRVRIKCRDVVKKLAIFKESLAIQFADRVLIYERDSKLDEFKYVLKDKISQAFECSLLVMCSENLILCQDKTLQCYAFDGIRIREWTLDSHIRYIRSVGGVRGKEVLVAGLKNGLVVKIFLDNPFPQIIVKVPQSVRCVDLNITHTKIAIVDESSTLFVYDLTNEESELLFEELNAISVFWNSSCEDLLSYSGFGVLNIKANGFPLYQQKMGGFVVGFNGRKVFAMQNSTVVTLEVPLTVPMYQYIEENQFKEAYKLSALGIPQKDWMALANAAILGMEMDIARKALTKIKKIQFLRMLDLHEEKIRRGEEKVGVFLGIIYAHQGKFSEGAQLFKENREEHRAVAMYADLRMFELAQEFLGGSDSSDGGDKSRIMKMKAEWALKINEPRAAAEMYLVAGDKLQAIRIMGDNKWTDMLLEVGRKLDMSDKEALTQCADSLVKLGQVSSAAEMYKRLGLQEKVLEIFVRTKDWQEAFLIVEKNPSLKRVAYLPYAQWLAESDRFAESQKAFHEAGCPEEAFKVLDQLKSNAVAETRFHDAGYYHWILSRQYLDLAIKELDEESHARHLNTCNQHEKKAAMYYAYNSIFRYTDQPFTPFMPDALFNISRFLMHELRMEMDLPISKFHVLYTLAKQARTLKAFKLARNVLESLKSIKVPRSLQDGLRLLMLSSKGDAFEDNEELLPMCYRCSTTNPLLNPRGNNCINCCHPFIYSFVSFEVLPLVEFQLEEGIADEEALGLIGSGLPAGGRVETKLEMERWQETTNEEVQVLHFDEPDEENSVSIPLDGSLDPFSARSITYQDGKVSFSPVILGRAGLRALEPTEVIIMKRGQYFRHRFFKNLLPDMSISLCHSCHKMFHTDDFVLQVLQKGHCPFCRSPPPSEGLER